MLYIDKLSIRVRCAASGGDAGLPNRSASADSWVFH
jgi:hypothetical protein